jgi:hypothetical protein
MISKSFPVVSLYPIQRSERFSTWVRAFGVFRLARSLAIDPRTVRMWLGSNANPNLNTAKAIIALSQVEPSSGINLTFEDIFGPALAEKVEVRQVQRVKAWE